MNKYKILTLLFVLTSYGIESEANLKPHGVETPVGLTKVEQAQLNEQLKEAVKQADFRKIEELLDQRADINFQNENGDTLLMIVASSLSRSPPESPRIGGGYKLSPNVALSSERWSFPDSKKQRELFQFLLQNKADRNIQNNQGWTVLMMCASLEDDFAVRLLTTSEAKLDIQDNEDRTALMFAAFQQNFNSVTILSKGADANITDRHDRTALIYALETLSSRNVATLSIYTDETGKNLALGMAKQIERDIKNILSVTTSPTQQQIQQGEDIRKIKETLQSSQNKPPKKVDAKQTSQLNKLEDDFKKDSCRTTMKLL